MKTRTSNLKFLAFATVFLYAGLAFAQGASSPHVIKVEGDVEGVHDPSIIAEKGTWYLFGTATEKGPRGQLPIRCSQDLHHWKRCGSVFADIPDWIKKESPETQDLWAPDVSIFAGNITSTMRFRRLEKILRESRW